jgi:glycosyltransferase involved in cell wall biosynthesis
MKIRVVDYVANLGGGVRFTVQLMRAISRSWKVSFEVVSHGDALKRYHDLLRPLLPATYCDIEVRPRLVDRILPRTLPGMWRLGLHPQERYDFQLVPRVLDDCDQAWFPWSHRHHVPAQRSSKVVASLHDLILMEFPDFFPDAVRAAERRVQLGWIASDARIVVSSYTTAAAMSRILGAHAGRTCVIPLSGRHAAPVLPAAPERAWPFRGRDYLLCPANITRHKNHEVLLAGTAAIAEKYPLVLTGDGTSLNAATPRGHALARLAVASGLEPGRTLFPIGYVDEAAYDQILAGACAVVMPTLAEGGGSFPVWEAVERGIPAVVSDIPVLREMIERLGGEVLWFDPHSPESLAAVLAAFAEEPMHFRRQAEAQTRSLRVRTWDDVAADYAALFGLKIRV